MRRCIGFPGPLTRSLLPILAALCFAIMRPMTARAGDNLLHNGDFKVGSGDSTDGWQNDAWIQSPGTTDYHWIRPAGGQPGEVELFTHKDNDARWKQPVTLTPGWYTVSVEARTEKVLPFFTGVSISTLDNGVMSADLRGDNDWKRLQFYLKVGPRGADVDVCLRLGGYMNLTRGRAFFRDAQVVKIEAPPAGADHVYDLDAMRKAQFSGPIGSPWSLAVTFVTLLTLAGLGWWLLGEPAALLVQAEQSFTVKRARKKTKARGR
jgi:hypothetical protein